MHGRRPLHPARRRARPGHRSRCRSTPRPARCSRRSAARGVALGLDADGRLAGLLTALGAAARRDLHPGARRRGQAAHRGRGRDQRRRGRQGEGAARRRAWTCWSSTPRTATRTRCSTRCGPSVRVGERGPDVPVAAGNVVTAEGRARPRRGGRGHRQGRRRAGRDVHHADDDRGRAPAVLRRARVRGGRARAGRAHLGRRRGAAPPRRGAGAGRGRVGRDDRVVAGGHLRVAGRPAARRVGAALQGVVRDGEQAGGERPHPRRRRLRPRPQGAVRGGHLVVAAAAGPAAARRGGRARRHLRGRAERGHLRRAPARWPSWPSAPRWASRRWRASPRAPPTASDDAHAHRRWSAHTSRECAPTPHGRARARRRGPPASP